MSLPISRRKLTAGGSLPSLLFCVNLTEGKPLKEGTVDTEEFNKLVADYINYDAIGGTCDEEKLLRLARQFKCAKSTVVGSWAQGHSVPGTNVKQAVAEYILDQNFKEAIIQYIGYNLSSSSYDKEKARKLAGEFEVAESTVIRWIKGTANPHPLIKQQVIDYIRKPKDFKEVVAEYIEYKEEGLRVTWSEEKVKILTEEFECVRKTVVCWANGLKNPRKRTKESVIRYINTQKK